ncbi:hypothetical protein DRQ26_04715 [bacterium]|nr:MAG: hypothetical protein DRQ26_04715 [bacterium]
MPPRSSLPKLVPDDFKSIALINTPLSLKNSTGEKQCHSQKIIFFAEIRKKKAYTNFNAKAQFLDACETM